MRYIEHKFTLDVNQTASQVRISVKKGDTARRLLIHLTESGYPYHLSDECYAVLAAQKPDGNVIFNNCTIDDCVIGYDFTAQTVAAAGIVNCDVIVYGAKGVQLTSASFDIVVEDTNYSAVESTSETGALAVLIQEIKALKAVGLRAPAIICGAEGETISLTDASDEAMQGLRILGKSRQNGVPTPDNPVEIVSVADGGSVGISVVGKNLLQIKKTTATMNNVTFTVNEDGSVTVKGTNNGTTDAYIRLVGTWGSTNNIHMLPKQNLILSGGSKDCLLNMFLFNSKGEATKGAYEIGVDPVTVSASLLQGKAGFTVYPTVKPGVTVNETIYPMLRLASIADGAYEPCKVQPLSAVMPQGCVLPGLRVTSGGNYTDSNGQRWVCDEIDLGQGVYVQRVQVVSASAFTSAGYVELGNYARLGLWIPEAKYNSIPTANGLCNILPFLGNYSADQLHFYVMNQQIWVFVPIDELEERTTEGVLAWLVEKGAKFQYILATPIEIELSAEEKAAFAALYTYKPGTFIYNDVDAYMAAEYVADTKTYIENKSSSTTVNTNLVEATVE